MANIQKENLEKLLNKQRSIKITYGSLSGIVLLIFFFTFAYLVDNAPPVFFIFETIVAAVIFVSYFMLNRLSFIWIKMTKSKKAEFMDIIPRLEAGDVDGKIDVVFERIK